MKAFLVYYFMTVSIGLTTACSYLTPPNIFPSSSPSNYNFSNKLNSYFEKTAESCGSRKTACFRNKAFDYIEFNFCNSDNPYIQPVSECDRIALQQFEDFSEQTEVYSSRRRTSRRTRSTPTVSEPESPIEGFCDRTEGVKTAILAKIGDAVECSAVTQTHLDEITELVITLNPRPVRNSSCPNGYSSLQSEDFSGLKNLKKISFAGTDNMGGCLRTVPKDIFSGLSKLEEIFWGLQSYLTQFHTDTFRNLNNLKKINLPECYYPELIKEDYGLNDEVVVVNDC